DVEFDPPTAPTGLTINTGSIIDLDPEFTISGTGLGTIAIDGTRAPIDVTYLYASLTGGKHAFRYWLTGNFAATGAVTVTYLPDSWGFNVPLTTNSTTVTLSLGAPEAFLTIVFPKPTSGYTLVESSIIDSGAEFQIAILDPASLGATPTFGGDSSAITAFGWSITIDGATAPTKIADGVYRYKLSITVTSPTLSSVVIQHKFIDKSWKETNGTERDFTLPTGADDPNDVTKHPDLRATLSLGQNLPSTVRITLPATPTDDAAIPAGFTLDPASITNDAFSLAKTGNWTITLDSSRAPVQIGNTNQYDVPIFIQLPASQPSASTTITLTITGLSYTGATS